VALFKVQFTVTDRAEGEAAMASAPSPGHRLVGRWRRAVSSAALRAAPP